jgi:predicted PurR-regulated permease PerM
MSTSAPSASPLARRLAPWLALTGLALPAFGRVGLFVGPIVPAVAWAVWREWATHLSDGEGG